jgi:hypothetical protein
MRGQNIVDLLSDNRSAMTEADVAEALGLKILDARGRLSNLVISEVLEKIPGIAATPARYRMRTRAINWPRPRS